MPEHDQGGRKRGAGKIAGRQPGGGVEEGGDDPDPLAGMPGHKKNRQEVENREGIVAPRQVVQSPQHSGRRQPDGQNGGLALTTNQVTHAEKDVLRSSRCRRPRTAPRARVMGCAAPIPARIEPRPGCCRRYPPDRPSSCLCGPWSFCWHRCAIGVPARWSAGLGPLPLPHGTKPF